MQTQLQADLFSVKVLKKFAAFKLFEKARLNDIGGLQRLRALIRDGSDVHESLDRFNGSAPEAVGAGLQSYRTWHHGYRLIARKIFLEDCETIVAFSYKMMDGCGVTFHEAPHGVFFPPDERAGRHDQIRHHRDGPHFQYLNAQFLCLCSDVRDSKARPGQGSSKLPALSMAKGPPQRLQHLWQGPGRRVSR